MKIRNSALTALAVSSLLAACGSASSGSTTSSGGRSVTGTVTKGPVNGATVTAYAIASGTMGAQVGSTTTDAQGHFAVPVGDYAGPMVVQASGGTYTDEATGTLMPMAAGDAMAAAVPSFDAGATTTVIQVTPLTSMAHERAHHMAGGITAANIVIANTAVGTYFGVSDILHTVPMNPMVAGSGAGASADARDYGMAIAAMSQYAHTIGMTDSSGIVTAMMNDASDGVMDGKLETAPIAMGGGMMGGAMMEPAAATTGLATAMGAFIASSMNRSGLQASDMQSLMDELSGSNGQLPGAGGGTTNGTMGGTVFLGSMSSGTVTAYAVNSGMMGAQLGSGPVDSTGKFDVAIGSYSGPVMLRVTGGAFMDEATGTTMTMQGGDVMTACVPSFDAGSTTSAIQVTPLTSMAQARAQGMNGGMTSANIGAANTAVGNYFMVGGILTTSPMDPAMAGSGAGATQDGKNYGMTIAGLSQYAHSMGMTTSSAGMVTAMMMDASDGVMNGMMGSTAISMTGMGGMMGAGMMPSNAGTSGLASAMTAFAGSSRNKSGVAASDVQALIDKLTNSNGAM